MQIHQSCLSTGPARQVDLLYPPAKDRPAGAAGAAGVPRSGSTSLPASAPTSPDAKSTASAATAATAAAVAAAAGPGSSGGAGRPAFAELLQQSLKVQSEMRAWFDEEVRYVGLCLFGWAVFVLSKCPCGKLRHLSALPCIAISCAPNHHCRVGRAPQPSLLAALMAARVPPACPPQVKYQYVRQTRVPKTLPQVLVVNCGLQVSKGKGEEGGSSGRGRSCACERRHVADVCGCHRRAHTCCYSNVRIQRPAWQGRRVAPCRISTALESPSGPPPRASRRTRTTCAGGSRCPMQRWTWRGSR